MKPTVTGTIVLIRTVDILHFLRIGDRGVFLELGPIGMLHLLGWYDGFGGGWSGRLRL
jgi:hypothetical protein